MKSIPGFPATVKEIGNLYEQLIKEWQVNRKKLDWSIAVAGDIGRLLLPVAVVHFLPGRSNKNIVIFGHTHGAKLLRKYDLNSSGGENQQKFLKKHLNKVHDRRDLDSRYDRG